MPEVKTGVREIFLRRDNSAKYLFLAAFLFNAAFIPLSLLISLTKEPLHPSLGTAFNIIFAILAVTCVTQYFRSTSANSSTSMRKSFFSSLLNTLTGVIFLLGVSLAFSSIVNRSFDVIAKLLTGQSIQNLVLILAGYLGLVIIVQFFLLAGVLLIISAFEYGIPPGFLGNAFKIICSKLLKRFFALTLFMVIVFLLNLVLMKSLEFTSLTLERIIPDAFLENYFNYMIRAALYGYMLFVLSGMVRFLFSGMGNIFQGMAGSGNISNKKLPVFSIFAVLLLILAYIFSPLKPSTDSVNFILSETQNELKLGETAQQGGVPALYINRYDRANSNILAFKGYLIGIKALRAKDMTMYQSAFDTISKAYAAYPENIYVQYLTGNLRSIENKEAYDSYLPQYILSIQHTQPLPEAYFGLLKGYAGKKDEAGIKTALSYIIDAQMFFDRFEGIKKLNDKGIDAALAKIEEMEIQIETNQIFKALEKIKYLDFKGALADVDALAKKYPDKELFQYYISEISNKIREEQSYYPLVKSSAENFSRMVDLEKHPDEAVSKELFKAEMQLNANDRIAAEQTLKNLYSINIGNVMVAEKYASVLLINSKNSEAIAVCEEILKDNATDSNTLYTLTMAQLAEKNYSKSLETMQKYSKTALDSKNEVLPGQQSTDESTYDFYLNRYAIRYSMALVDPAAGTALEAVSADTILYNYILGMKKWQEQDNAKSIDALKKVVKADKNLGYAYYHIAVNYHESIKKSGGKDFSIPAQYYLKSLELQPEHAEGYFSLGHCFKEWGKYKEALAAFRRVVDIWPYEDHVIDTFGTSIHASGLINELAKYDDLGVN